MPVAFREGLAPISAYQSKPTSWAKINQLIYETGGGGAPDPVNTGSPVIRVQGGGPPYSSSTLEIETPSTWENAGGPGQPAILNSWTVGGIERGTGETLAVLPGDVGSEVLLHQYPEGYPELEVFSNGIVIIEDVGFDIPVGSLDVWKTARDNHASARAETVVFGDSTTADSGADYSWVYRVRELAITAAYTDGGRGLVEPFDTATRSGPTDNLNCIQSQTGWDSAANVFPGMFPCFVSETAADELVLQGNGTAIRIWWSRGASVGDFTYAVDGGAPVTVHAYENAAPTTGCALISGLSSGLHTLTVINAGGRPYDPPVIVGGGQDSPGTGTLPAATYYYVVTGVTVDGETLQSEVFTIVNDGGARQNTIVVSNVDGFVSYNVYRTTASSSGPFDFLLNQAASVGGFSVLLDTGSETPNGAVHPPETSTAGLNVSAKNAGVVADFMYSTGLVWHKNAASGSTFNTWGLEGTYNNFPYQAALGLTQVASGWTPDARPPGRIPALAICNLGTNNQQGATSETKAAALAACATGTQTFIDAALAAGADVLVVLPAFKRAANSEWAPEFRAAILNVAISNGVAWVDFDFALDAAGYGLSGPHLDQAGYNIEADYTWNNVLAA